jgi:hypothetical protein
VKETGINIFIPFAAQAACIKTDVESLPERLTFGTNVEAVARRITAGLPETEPDFSWYDDESILDHAKSSLGLEGSMGFDYGPALFAAMERAASKNTRLSAIKSVEPLSTPGRRTVA